MSIREKGFVPIIYLTGYGDSVVRECAIRTMPVSYLTKPAHIPDLKAIIDAHFGMDS
jgi:CheY-like chemotaxis protein